MLTLAYPWALLLLPLPWLLRPWLTPYREARLGLRVPFLDRLAKETGQDPGEGAIELRGGWWRFVTVVAFWLCVVVALARPQWLGEPVVKTVPVRDMLLAVDLSGSMETKDFTNAVGQKVDRLTAVKEVLDGFLERRKGDRVGLIVFGSAPFLQAPFLEDLDTCRELLGECRVGMAGPKTALGDAMGLAMETFKQSDAPERVLITLTDGNDTGSLVPPEKAAEIARDEKVVVHCVAVGDLRAAGEEKLDEETLRKVAATTGGVYARATDRAQLEAVYDRLDALQTRQADTISYRPRFDLFHWPLGVGLLLTFALQAGALLTSRRAA